MKEVSPPKLKYLGGQLKKNFGALRRNCPQTLLQVSATAIFVCTIMLNVIIVTVKLLESNERIREYTVSTINACLVYRRQEIIKCM